MLRIITEEELKIILEKHKKWLNREKGGERADLSYCDLSFKNLFGAKLRGADLRGANLRGADLRYADLRYANLSHANLSCANLSYADLSYANLSYADLSHANLSYANLSYADLSCANLSGADLFDADLFDANLSGADLFDALLDEKEKCRLGVILQKKIIGYKKCQDDIIVKLEIPKGAVVFSINNNKCRTNKAKVIEISEGKEEAISTYDNSFIYKVGETYEIKNFNMQYNEECGAGIHFFRTEEEAKAYRG